MRRVPLAQGTGGHFARPITPDERTTHISQHDADTKFSSPERVPTDVHPAVSGAEGDGEKTFAPGLGFGRIGPHYISSGAFRIR